MSRVVAKVQIYVTKAKDLIVKHPVIAFFVGITIGLVVGFII